MNDSKDDGKRALNGEIVKRERPALPAEVAVPGTVVHSLTDGIAATAATWRMRKVNELAAQQVQFVQTEANFRRAQLDSALAHDALENVEQIKALEREKVAAERQETRNREKVAEEKAGTVVAQFKAEKAKYEADEAEAKARKAEAEARTKRLMQKEPQPATPDRETLERLQAAKEAELQAVRKQLAVAAQPEHEEEYSMSYRRQLEAKETELLVLLDRVQAKIYESYGL